MATCKNLQQWKARALVASIPLEAVFALRSLDEAVQALVIRYIFEAQIGDLVSANLESRDHYIDEHATTWLSQ